VYHADNHTRTNVDNVHVNRMYNEQRIQKMEENRNRCETADYCIPIVWLVPADLQILHVQMLDCCVQICISLSMIVVIESALGIFTGAEQSISLAVMRW